MRAGDPLITYRTWVYHLIVVFLHVVYRTYFRTRVRGREHVPRRGRVLIVSNHQSGLDIPLHAFAGRRHLAFIGRDSLAENRFLGWVMRRCGAILIARGRGDRAALRRVVEHLRAEDAVVVFAEGTRSRSGRLGRFRRGALFTARSAQAPMVPCAVSGSFAAMPPGARVPRPRRLAIEFFPAVEPDASDALERVRRTIAEALGEDTEPQLDLLDVPPDPAETINEAPPDGPPTEEVGSLEIDPSLSESPPRLRE